MFRAHGVVFGTLIVLVCGDPVAPRPEPYLRLVLSSRSAGPGQVIVVEAAVSNAGAPVQFSSGCADEDGIWFEVLDPSGRRVTVMEPGTLPACASSSAQLLEGEELVTRLRFDGNLYEGASRRQAGPGRYVVIARFRFWPGPTKGEAIMLEQRVSFLWLERAVP